MFSIVYSSFKLHELCFENIPKFQTEDISREYLFQPIFDTRLPTNINVSSGDTAYLKCRAYNRDQKTVSLQFQVSLESSSWAHHQVSWIREDRTQILAAGSYTYISDNRYTATHVSEEDTWTLVIKNVSVQDNGVFECQVRV